jgi:hypothetical protein
MRDMKIIEVDMNDNIFDLGDRYCMTERNERYFIAFEANPLKRHSVLWADLKFIRKNFGVDRLTGVPSETSKFTNKSLNYSRSINIADMKKAIEMNVVVYDLDMLNEDGTWELVDDFITDQYGNKRAGKVPFTPRPLTKSLKAMYKAEIAKGLFVVCKAI